jgi:dipeptidyl aminopeptidase/acylaminoacyl peptidase
MQAQSSPRQANNYLAWVIAAFGLALMLLLFLSFMADSRPAPSGEVAGSITSRIAYLEFGLNADTLWIAEAAAPDRRQEVFSIAHAAEYGAVPAVSPDGRRVAYTALPEGLARPEPDSPAGLWVASIEAGDQPRLLADGVDLLVAPLWTPDSATVVFRRSTEAAQVIAIAGIEGGEERVIAYSETESLFPVGFTAGAGSLYFVGLSEYEGTRLYEVSLATGVDREVATLSPGLTRDWALSQDGSKLAYLEIAFTEAAVASRASVLDLAGGGVVSLTAAGELALGPVWSDAGRLAFGVFDPATGEASLLLVDGASRSRIERPGPGFDVPLAYDAAAGAYLVSAFENDSFTAPGRSTLVLVAPDGTRKTVVEGEVTLVGWIRP